MSTQTRPAPGGATTPAPRTAPSTPAAGSRPGRWWHALRTYRPSAQLVPLLATLALFLGMLQVGGLRYEGFTSSQVILNLLTDNAFLVVLAVGMTFVILTGGIDLSVGSVVALSTMVAAWTLQDGWSPYAAIAATLTVGTVLGLLTGLVIHHFDVQPFIATLAGMFLARGLCYLISVESIPIRDDTFFFLASEPIPIALAPWQGGVVIGLLGLGMLAALVRRRSLRSALVPVLVGLGVGMWVTLLLMGDPALTTTYSVVIALATVAVAVLVLHRTRFGRTVYAIGGSEASALLMGLRVGLVKVGVYAVSGFCASLGGLLFAFYMLSGYSLHAVGMELDAIAAVVIGGTLLAGGRGLVVGSLLGVLVLGTIQTFISFDGTLSSWWTKIVIGALVLVFVVMQRVLTRRQP
ncbi:sugar ABC transporter permease YjfF [Nocardioides sp. CFH 31398]|uniref:ABC transporter permease subunit n=1 Tax=Nocardioides sp. CFH 31398 TaxID=2919579 RepID=UPI001F06B771|nr:sugar ABC transporter permease YjfF [Nocardioides sp. CFH 31398]MCH1866082.1 sugar ABC transporter permease YjfF [Nocardioides sp. CFH 31398]